MGIELKLAITKDDMKSLYAGEDRTALLAALKDGSSLGYSPNLLLTPVTSSKGGFLNPKVVENLSPQIGEERYATFIKLLESAEMTRRELLKAVVEGRTNIDDLLEEHHSELRGFVEWYSVMDKVDSEGMNKYQKTLFDLGMTGLALVILHANALYGQQSRTEFLQHVHQGVIEKGYQQVLLAEAGLSMPKVL